MRKDTRHIWVDCERNSRVICFNFILIIIMMSTEAQKERTERQKKYLKF